MKAMPTFVGFKVCSIHVSTNEIQEIFQFSQSEDSNEWCADMWTVRLDTATVSFMFDGAMSESISTRIAKLNQVFSGKNVAKKASFSFTREALVDAFLVLFDQCDDKNMRTDKNVAAFVKKCEYCSLFTIAWHKSIPGIFNV